MSAALIGVMGGVAQASTGTCYGDCARSTTGSTVYAGPYSSGYMYVQVCDTQADGHSAYDWYNLGDSTHQPTNRQETSGGSGTCTAAIIYHTNEITMEACRISLGIPIIALAGFM